MERSAAVVELFIIDAGMRGRSAFMDSRVESLLSSITSMEDLSAEIPLPD